MGFKLLIRLAAAAVLTFAATMAAAEPHRLVAFGDSLMAGYGLDAGQSFPERLEAVLRQQGYEVNVANAGVSGDTTSGGLARLDWSIPEDTDLVILGLGANDMLRGVSPTVTRDNLQQMMEILRDRQIEVVLVGMLAAPSMGSDYEQAFNAIYPELAAEFDVPLYPFFLEGVATERGLLLEDGMHPNQAGVERMVEGVVPVVEQALDLLGD